RRGAVSSPSTAWPRISAPSAGRARARAPARLWAATLSSTRRSFLSPGLESTRNGRLASVSSTRRTRSGQWPRRTARTASGLAMAAAGGRVRARITASARTSLRDPLVRPQASAEFLAIHHRFQCQGLPGGQGIGADRDCPMPLAPGQQVVVALLADLLAVVAAEGEAGQPGVAGSR